MRRLPWIVAAGSLLGGFIAMGAVSLIWTPTTGLPDMWQYWSGTAGDLFLPIVLYGVTRGCLLLGLPGERPSRWSLVVGLFGAGLGAYSQVAWLSDPAPRLNWMLIEPHRFSAIGWYHAGFVVIVSGYVAATAYELLRRARAARQQPGMVSGDGTSAGRDRVKAVLSGNGSALVISAGALFVLSVVADSVPSQATPSSQATIGAVVATPLLMLAVTTLMLRRGAVLVAGPVLVAIGVAASALMLATSTASVANLTIAATVAALVGLGLATTFYRGGSILRSDDVRFIAPPVGCLLLVSLVGRMSAYFWHLFLILGAIVVVIVLSDTFGPTTPQRTVLLKLLTALSICLTAALSVLLPGTGHADRIIQVILGVLAILLGLAASRRILDAWRAMVEAERSDNESAPGTPSRRLGPATIRAWITAFTIGLGSFLALAPMALETVGDTLDLGVATPNATELAIVAVGTVAGGVLGCPTVVLMFHDDRFPRDTPPGKQPASGWIIAAAGFGLMLLAGVAVWLAVIAGWHGPNSVVIVAVASFLMVDCLQTTVFDGTLMCMRWPGAIDWLAGTVAAVVQGAALYWALLSGTDAGGLQLGHALLLFAIAILPRLVASVVAGGVMYARGRNYYATYLPLWWIYIQNELIRTTLMLLIIWFPAFVVTHSSAMDSGRWLDAMFATAPVLALAAPLYLYASQRMLEHSYEQRKKRFGGRYATEKPSSDARRMARGTVQLIGQFLQYLRARRPTTAVQRARLMEEDFVRALSANLALQTLIRTAVVSATVFGLIIMVGVVGAASASHANGSST